MTADTPTILCEFDVSGRSSYRSRDCGQPAVSAVKIPRIGGGTYEGRCKRHASVDKRRRYGNLEPVELTPEVVSEITSRTEEHKAAVEEERKRKREAHERAVENQRLAAWRDATTPVVFTREDRPGDIDWDAVAALRAAGEPLPQQYPTEPATPRWVAPTPRLWDLEVELQQRAKWPTAIKVRTSSELTLRQAAALRDMLTAALAAALQEEQER